ncbi:MAG: large subunit ribosomal protein L28 [Lentimonas sp.]|jgi:large subunit ribosomal protein L28
MSRRCDLMAAVGVVSGNNVSHSNRKTKRRFLPNLCQNSFPSDALGVKVNLRVAASTLRTVNKFGNIDNFLVNCRFNKLTEAGIRIRNKIIKALIRKGNFDEVKVRTRKVSNVK